MSSLKITFSLASLILILGLVSATVPAMAVTTDTAIGIGDSQDNNGTIDVSKNRFGTIGHAGTIPAVTSDITPTLSSKTALPDLDAAFFVGTTIALLAPATTQLDGTKPITGTADAVQAKDVVISEIMWGIDHVANKSKQWIEFYNTTAGDGIDANMEAWILYFVDDYNDIPAPAEKKVDADGNSTTTDDIFDVENVVELDLDGNAGKEPYVLVDIVSNHTTARGGWVNTIGQGGGVMISMYRNIDYETVTQPDHDTDPAKNRAKQLEGIPSGIAKDSWKASQRLFKSNRKGSPNRPHLVGVTTLSASTVNLKKVILNEIGNSSKDTYDWIELRNTSGADIVIENYELSHVVGTTKTDVSLVIFPKIKIPRGGVLLVVNSDPKFDANHPLAAGVNVIDEEGYTAGDLIKNGLTSRYYVNSGLKIPDKQVLFILRSVKEKRGTDAEGLQALVDVTGTASIADTADTLATGLWPLVNTDAAHTALLKGVTDGTGTFADNTVYRRAKPDKTTDAKEIWVASEDAGGIGYKRRRAGNGTPGYANDALKKFEAKARNADGTKNGAYVAAPVTISEIMYDSGERKFPQWIELYNASMTDAILIEDWHLKLENAADVTIFTNVTFKLSSKIIPPNQTVLIVAKTGRHSGEFPNHRVLNLWKDGLKDSKDRLEIREGTTLREFRFLSETAFRVTLMDVAGNQVDVAGNLVKGGRTPSVAWPLPPAGENRASIIRRYNAGMAQNGTMAPPVGWAVANAQETYYGSTDDLGTPGYRAGGALPVSLSKFRPERKPESGDIVIRWITESELNNAGFNILRSETRNGEFTKINTKLIAGKGTTSERTTYTWKDTSAKPNVVYYYQIQDVSLDGQVQTLRQSRLKGNVTAAGKLTTTWGELKALQ